MNSALSSLLFFLLFSLSSSKRYDYDYIIVGAGTGGTSLAYTLTENPNVRVLLIEEGPRDISLPKIYDAANWFGGLLYDPVIAREYLSEPEPHMNGRSLWNPRAKVTGGCDSHNAMVWILGNRKDFDGGETDIGHRTGWGEENEGWLWNDLEPYWTFIEENQRKTQTEEDYYMTKFIAAAESIGYDHIEDPNDLSGLGQGGVHRRIFSGYLEPVSENSLGNADGGDCVDGVCTYPNTTEALRGVRASVWSEFGKEMMKRDNLDLVVHTRVEKLLVRHSKIVGVQAVDVESGRSYEWTAKREYILSGGAMNTPQILLLSGIGPREHLEEMGIPVKLENNAVGQHLQNHLFLPVWGPPLKAEYQLPKSYFGNSGALAIEKDGLYYHGITASTNFGTGQPSLGVFAEVFHYDARGNVTLASTNPADHPIFTYNFLATQRDQERAIGGIRKARELLFSPALAEFHDGNEQDEASPGYSVQTDAEILEFIKATATDDFHPSGSCRMGPDSQTACVDNELKFYGIRNLRIVDASIFPELISGNPNQITMIIGMKAGDLILDDLRRRGH